YMKLLEYLELEDKEIKTYDFAQQLALPCNDLLERFNIDTRYIYPHGDIIKIEDFDPQYVAEYVGIYDQFGVFWGNSADKDLDDILYFDPVIHPLSNFTTIQDIENYDWPDGKNKVLFKGLAEYAKKLRDSTEYAFVSPIMGCVYEYTMFLFGFSKALIYLRKRPDLIIATMEKLLEYWIDYNYTFMSEVGQYIDIVCINGDLAEQAGPMMNLKTYESLIKPMERKLSEKVHEIADIKINYHSCGSITQFIPHWAEIGYDAFNPVQISARDMEPCSLKERYGAIITFWGGACDSQQILPFGSPDQIRNEVRKNLNCFKPDGGYIASSIHNITAEVPPENIVAMFDALNEFRDY
ncbi:MAG: uroporphyrinogen decarboxylase family protein, partial [Promethearchaeota archaeon]